MRAAESQTDRHLVVEFSGVVFSTVGVGARHYGVVAIAVVVVIIVVFTVVVVAAVVAVIVLPVFTPQLCRCRCPLLRRRRCGR